MVKYELYTKAHNEKILKIIDNDGGQFTAEEHAYAIEKEFEEHFKNRDTLLGWYLPNAASSLFPLRWLIQHIKESGFKNIISMGAGNCVHEYILKCALPEDCNVTATDFDSYYIKKSKTFFPSINSIKFDFFKDDIGKLNSKFDLAIFLGSAYVMNDEQFINLFKQLKENGVNQIIDFHAGYLPYKNIPLYLGGYVMRKVLRKLNLIHSHRGKFHGYGRTKDELRYLYKKTGAKSVIEKRVDPYKYVAICNY